MNARATRASPGWSSRRSALTGQREFFPPHVAAEVLGVPERVPEEEHLGGLCLWAYDDVRAQLKHNAHARIDEGVDAVEHGDVHVCEGGERRTAARVHRVGDDAPVEQEALLCRAARDHGAGA